MAANFVSTFISPGFVKDKLSWNHQPAIAGRALKVGREIFNVHWTDVLEFCRSLMTEVKKGLNDFRPKPIPVSEFS